MINLVMEFILFLTFIIVLVIALAALVAAAITPQIPAFPGSAWLVNVPFTPQVESTTISQLNSPLCHRSGAPYMLLAIAGLCCLWMLAEFHENMLPHQVWRIGLWCSSVTGGVLSENTNALVISAPPHIPEPNYNGLASDARGVGLLASVSLFLAPTGVGVLGILILVGIAMPKEPSGRAIPPWPCMHMVPKIHDGLLLTSAILSATLGLLLLSGFIKHWTQKGTEKRAQADAAAWADYRQHSLGLPPRRRTPVNITVVAHVPSLTHWNPIPLPFPKREVAAGQSDTSRPVCTICTKELEQPYVPADALSSNASDSHCISSISDSSSAKDITGKGYGSTNSGSISSVCSRLWFPRSDWTADPLWGLPCKHTFHEECCSQWFAADGIPKRCPTCDKGVPDFLPPSEDWT